MKNIQVSFRLTQWQLAHALEIIQALEPNYHPVSLSAMMKLVCQDYLAKMSIVSNPWPTEQALDEIKQMMIRSTGSQKIIMQKNNDQEELNNIMEAKKFPVPQITPQQIKRQNERMEATALQSYYGIDIKEASNNKSEKTIVTDFKPPTMEELNQEEK